jgi:hypothetical protein
MGQAEQSMALQHIRQKLVVNYPNDHIRPSPLSNIPTPISIERIQHRYRVHPIEGAFRATQGKELDVLPAVRFQYPVCTLIAGKQVGKVNKISDRSAIYSGSS